MDTITRPDDRRRTTAAVEVYLPCVKCGFDLCGLPRGGDCPRCSSEISRSTHPNRLYFADRAWLGTVAQGFNILFVIVTVLIATAVASAVSYGLYLLYRTQLTGTPLSDNEVIIPVLVVVYSAMFSVTIAAIFVWPVWRITTPEPGFNRRSLVRWAARWSAVAAGGIGVLSIPAFLVGPVAMFTVWTGVYMACSSLWTVCLFATSLYTAALAWRVPRRWLTAETVLVMLGVIATGWGMVIAISVTFAGLITALIVAGYDVSVAERSIQASSLTLVMFIFLCCAMSGFVLWWLVIFVRYRALFQAIHLNAIASGKRHPIALPVPSP